jgi:hypothetical protein
MCGLFYHLLSKEEGMSNPQKAGTGKEEGGGNPVFSGSRRDLD